MRSSSGSTTRQEPNTRSGRTRRGGPCTPAGSSARYLQRKAMPGKESWRKPAAWAVTHNESLWTKFDSIADRAVVLGWSLGDTYKTQLMEPGDRTIFWIVGRNG